MTKLIFLSNKISVSYQLSVFKTPAELTVNSNIAAIKYYPADYFNHFIYHFLRRGIGYYVFICYKHIAPMGLCLHIGRKTKNDFYYCLSGFRLPVRHRPKSLFNLLP